MPCHQEATAIHALPVEPLACGFRMLVVRELRSAAAPPAFALIDQDILRTPERRNRHGISFAATFRPEIMDWLIAELGRPSQRSNTGEARRNERWPQLAWLSEERDWPEGLHTIEWSVEITFADQSSWQAFQARWQRRLAGASETDPPG